MNFKVGDKVYCVVYSRTGSLEFEGLTTVKGVGENLGKPYYRVIGTHCVVRPEEKFTKTDIIRKPTPLEEIL